MAILCVLLFCSLFSKEGFGYSDMDWSLSSSHIHFLSYLSTKLKLYIPLDMVRIKSYQFRHYGGAGLLFHHYKNSVSSFLRTQFPELFWPLWLFPSPPKNWHKEEMMESKYFQWLGTKLKYEKEEDWYSLTPSLLVKYNGKSIFKKYKYEVIRFVQTHLPHHSFTPWRFSKPFGFWKNEKTHKLFLSWVEEEIISIPQDWFKMTRKKLEELGGHASLKHFNTSTTSLITSQYPEFSFKAWRFPRLSSHFLSCKKSKKELREYIQSSTVVVRKKDLRKMKGTKVLSPSPSKLSFPHKSQEAFTQLLKRCFPSTQVNSEVVEKGVGVIDITLPEMAICVEYQGEQHYSDVTRLFPEHKVLVERDKRKRELCGRRGYSLFEVGFWWEEQEEKVKKEMCIVRPDLCVLWH